MKNLLKRLTGFVLALTMLLAVCPLEALAEEVTAPEEEPVTVTEETAPVEVDFVEAEQTRPEPGTAVLMEDTYTSGDYTYTLRDGKAEITGYTGPGGDLTIPEELDGHVVDAIHEYVFSENTSLTAVILPSTLTKLGANVFQDCTSLQSVTIPAGLTDASWSAFEGCSQMREVNFEEGITKIPGCLFSNCEWMTHIEIPDTVTEIEARAFQGCKNLETVDYGKQVTVIGECAFNGCASLTSPPLPLTVTELGGSAFQDCTSLQSVTIPAGLTDTAWSAFEGCSQMREVNFEEGITKIPGCLFSNCEWLTHIEIPDTVTEIGGRAFAGCENLVTLAIPSQDCTIGEYAFNGDAGLTLFCPYISLATLYAIDNSIPFEPCGVFTDSDGYALDHSATRLDADLNGMTASGYVNFTLNYKIKEVWKDRVSEMKAVIRLPDNVMLDETSLRVGDSACSDFLLDDDEVLLTIPLTQTEGVIRYTVKVARPGSLVGYAKLTMLKDDEMWTEEVMGVLNERTALLTLDVPDQTGEETFTVSGIAPASAAVTLSVNGVETPAVTASKAGNWTAQVTLDDPRNYMDYPITASCRNGDEILEQTDSVVYRTDAASVTGFLMKYNEHDVIKTCDLLNTNGVKPKVYFLPETEFVFEVRFDHPEQINRLYVTSTRNGEKKYLEALYDQTSGAFVTSGFFDPLDKGYIPGIISLEYTRKVPEVRVGQEMDLKAMAPLTGLDASTAVEVKTNTANQYEATINMSDLLRDGGEVSLDTSISLYDETLDGNLSDWLDGLKEAGKFVTYIIKGENGEDIEISLDYSNPYKYLIIIHEISTDKFIKMVLDNAVEMAEFGSKELLRLMDVASILSTTGDITGLLVNEYEISRDMDKLREEVLSSPNLTASQRMEAMSKVDELEFDESFFVLMTTILPLIAAAPVATIGVGMSAAPLLLFTGIVALMTAVAPYFWDIRAAHIKGEKHFLTWVADPSGYVYDAETNARLEDVTATAYCILYDDMEGFWERTPGEDEHGTVWNALEYDQANPLRTNADGKYAWDVPEGWWRVKYEKEDYATTWSGWMPVPPIQTEVNIGMVRPFAVEYTEVGETSGAVTLTNNTEETAGITLILAAYDGDGRMISVGSQTDDLEASDSLSVSVSYQKSDGVRGLRAFVLDAGSHAPLCAPALKPVG